MNNRKIFVEIEVQESLEEYKTNYLLYQKDNQISPISPNNIYIKIIQDFNKELRDNEINKNK